jgi:undecaprenyl diphosphate synthase
MLMKMNVVVRVIGKLELLRADVRECFKKVEEETGGNTGMRVNLCFAYDSID